MANIFTYYYISDSFSTQLFELCNEMNSLSNDGQHRSHLKPSSCLQSIIILSEGNGGDITVSCHEVAITSLVTFN